MLFIWFKSRRVQLKYGFYILFIFFWVALLTSNFLFEIPYFLLDFSSFSLYSWSSLIKSWQFYGRIFLIEVLLLPFENYFTLDILSSIFRSLIDAILEAVLILFLRVLISTSALLWTPESIPSWYASSTYFTFYYLPIIISLNYFWDGRWWLDVLLKENGAFC